MNFIIHLSAISDEHFIKNVQRLLKVDTSQVREASLTIPSLAMVPTLPGVNGSMVEEHIPEFPQQLNSFLPTNQNLILRNKLNQKIKSIIIEDEKFVKASEQKHEDIPPACDLLIFDNEEIIKFPHIINSLFKALEARPCSLLLLDSKTTDIKKIILKYSGKEPSIYSIYAFSKGFPEITKKAEDTILISPFTFRKPQLALEKHFVKKIGAYYNALGFIKLPFNDAEDYYYYGMKVNADLLVFPKSDLKGIKNFILDHMQNYKQRNKGISIFFG